MGWGKLLEIPEKKNQFGLGCKPTNMGSQKNSQRKLYTLKDVFHGARYMDQDRVAQFEAQDEGIPNLVRRCSSDTALNNWKAIEIPEMISILK